MRADHGVTPEQPPTPRTAQQRRLAGVVERRDDGGEAVEGWNEGVGRAARRWSPSRALPVLGLPGLGLAALVGGIAGSGAAGPGMALPVGPLAPATVLEASSDPLLDGDYDDDGLTDEQEELIGTHAWEEDSDSDGYDDAEEIARGSNPLDMFSTPSTTVPSAGLLAHGRGGDLRLVMAVHEPTGHEGDALVRIGMTASGQVFNVPVSRLLEHGTISYLAGSSGSTIQVIDVPLSPGLVHAHGHVTFFAASGSVAQQSLEQAALVQLHSDGNHVFLQANLTGSQSQKDQIRYGGETIREPIPVDDVPPPTATFIAGAVCFQRSEVIGVNGSRMLHQVVEADCVPGWDTFCSTDCSAALGTTFETIDPWALIGN